jgi:hypothetical protein
MFTLLANDTLKKFNAIGVKQQIIFNTWHLAHPNLQNRESANE